MARIRTIKPEFWEDEKIGRLPIPCRLFFIGCWNFADDFGFIKGNASLLKSQIFPYDEGLRVSEIKKWIDALVNARMLIPIIYDPQNSGSGESYYYIRTFRSHQVLDKRFEKSYVGKDVVKELINKALQDYNDNTSCSRSNHDVITTAEKEMEKEKEDTPLSTNVDIPPMEGVHSQEDLDDSGKSLFDPHPQFRCTPSPDFEKFQKWIEANAPRVAKMKEPFSEAQFSALKKDFSSKYICNLLRAMHNYEPLLKKNRSANLTFRQWAKREQKGDFADGRKITPKSESEKTTLLERLENNG